MMTMAGFKFPSQRLTIPPSAFGFKPFQASAAPRIQTCKGQRPGQRLRLAHGSDPDGVSVCVRDERKMSPEGRP